MMTYKTKDFYLACLLKASDYKFIGSEKHSENTVFFIFEYENETELRLLVDRFINMEAMANVRKFTYAMSDLRDELNKYKDVQFRNKR
jgi:hypothetical protein